MFCRSFFFGRCVVCSSIYGFWLLLYYLCTSYLNFLKPVFSRVHVTRSLVLYVCFVDHCLSFCTFFYGRCVVCSSIYGFWLLLNYLCTSYLNFLKPVFSGVHVTRSLVSYVCFVDRFSLVVVSSVLRFTDSDYYYTTCAWQSYLNFLKPVFSRVHVTRSLVLYVCFVDHCLSFCTFFYGRCVVCSSIYDSDYY